MKTTWPSMFVDNDSGTGHQKTTKGGGGRTRNGSTAGRFECLSCECCQSVEQKLGNRTGEAGEWQEKLLVRWRAFGLTRGTTFVFYCWIRLIAIIHSHDDEHTDVLIPVSRWCESPEPIAQNWRIIFLAPESWLFVSINSPTDSVLRQLTMKRPDEISHILAAFVRTSISIYQANGSVRSFPPRCEAELRANESPSGSRRPGQPHEINKSLGCSGCECPYMDFCTLLVSVSDSLWWLTRTRLSQWKRIEVRVASRLSVVRRSIGITGRPVFENGSKLKA